MQKKKVALGSYNNLSTNINGMDVNKMSFNNICFLTGMNGVGKTLILILTWLVNMVTFTWVLVKGIPQAELLKFVNFLFEKSFDRCDFTCFIEAEYDELTLRIELDRGVVTSVVFTPKDPNVEFVSSALPTFMSKDTRTFGQISQYLKTKKLMSIGPIDPFASKDLDKLTELYKIYDIFFIERMIAKISDPNYKMDESIIKPLDEMIPNRKIRHISYDDIGCNFIIHEEKDGKTSKYHATMLSAGEQSLVNMFVNSRP